MNFNIFSIISVSDFLNANLSSILLIDTDFSLLNAIKAQLKKNLLDYQIIDLGASTKVKEESVFTIYTCNHKIFAALDYKTKALFKLNHILKQDIFEFHYISVRIPFKFIDGYFYTKDGKTKEEYISDSYFKIFSDEKIYNHTTFNSNDPRPFIYPIKENNLKDFIFSNFKTNSKKLKRLLIEKTVIKKLNEYHINTIPLNILFLCYNENRTIDCLFNCIDLASKIRAFNFDIKNQSILKEFMDSLTDKQVEKALLSTIKGFNEWSDLLNFYAEIREIPQKFNDLTEVHDFLSDKVFESSLAKQKISVFKTNRLMELEEKYNIFVPKTVNDLILISKKFKNCVKTYYNEIENDISWVFTIKINNTECCVQVNSNTGKIVQCKGIRNSTVDSQYIFKIKTIVDKLNIGR